MKAYKFLEKEIGIDRMKFKLFGCLVAIIWMSLFTHAQEPIEIESLIKDVLIDRQKDALSGYSYEMEFIQKKKYLLGSTKLVRRYQVILPSRFPPNQVYKHSLLLIYDSAKQRSASDIISDRDRIIEQLNAIENKADGNDSQKKTEENKGGYVTLRAGKDAGDKNNLSINLLKLVENSTFSNAKELKVNGRDTISIDFRPLPESNLEDDLFYLTRIEGEILIDKADKRIIAVEAYPLGKLNEYRTQIPEEKEQARVFYYLQTRVPEGFWFPQKVLLNLMSDPEEYKDNKIKIEFNFSKYKRFVAGVESFTPEIEKLENNTPETEKPKDN